MNEYSMVGCDEDGGDEDLENLLITDDTPY